jgi:hypothetical protein
MSFYGFPKFTATSPQDYNLACFGCLVSQPRGKVKREVGDSESISIDGHSGTAPRCCKPDDSGYMPLRDVVRTGRCRKRMTASQKTGPRSRFGIPRGGVKPAVWFRERFPFPSPDYLRSRRGVQAAASFPDEFFEFRCLNPHAFFRATGSCGAGNTQYRTIGNRRNVPVVETVQQVPVQLR